MLNQAKEEERMETINAKRSSHKTKHSEMVATPEIDKDAVRREINVVDWKRRTSQGSVSLSLARLPPPPSPCVPLTS